MIRVGVVGASGYVGVELCRLLSSHPDAKISKLYTHSSAGQTLSDQFKSLLGVVDLPLEPFDAMDAKAHCDMVFLSLPHGASGDAIMACHDAGLPLIDLSADLRYRDAQVYADWYGKQNAVAHLLPKAVYGLSEVYRKTIASCDLIANPGCYTTAAILPLRPLLAEKQIIPQGIVINSASGVTGAGKNPSTTTHFCEVMGNYNAYGATTHRHTSEIEQELSLAAGQDIVLTFVPHLLPTKRGILSTIYAMPQGGATAQTLHDALTAAYGNEPFIRIRPVGQLPSLHDVVGSNRVDIGLVQDQRNGRIVIVSVLDNLIKGAAGQAIQNLNIRFSLTEAAGLPVAGWYL